MMRVILLLLYFLGCVLVCSGKCVPYSCPAEVETIPTIKSGAPNTFHLGYIAQNVTDPTAASMVRWTVYDINMNTSILPDTYIALHSWHVNNMQELIAATLELVEVVRVGAVVMDLTEAWTSYSAAVIANSNIPVLHTTSITTTFNNKDSFNNLMVRLATPMSYQSFALVSLLAFFNYTECHFIYSNDQYGSQSYIDFKSQADDRNITAVAVQLEIGVDNVPSASVIDARAYILATNPEEGFPFLEALTNQSAYGPSYIWMFTYTMGQYFNLQTYVTQAFSGDFITVPSTSQQTNNPYYTYTHNGWMNSNITLFPGNRPDTYGPINIDAVQIVAQTVNELMIEGVPVGNISGSIFYNRMMSEVHHSQTGDFMFNSDGDRIGNFGIYNTHADNFPRHVVQVAFYNTTQNTFNITGEINFYNGSLVNPMTVVRLSDICSFSICNFRGNCSDVGACICQPGFSGQYCEVINKNSSVDVKSLIAWVIPVGVVVIGLIVATLLYLRRRRVALMKEMKDRQRSEISREDIKLLERIGRGASGEVYRGSFRGTEIAVKKLSTKNASKDLIDEFMFEVAVMCGLRHPNIILFMGSCLDQANKEMLLVMEMMQRGSLYDVLHNPKIMLSYDLQLHLACQAAQGMGFLHASKPPIIHRDMKSHNILLDDKWNARISDFGITRFKDLNGKDSKQKSDRSIGTIFWAAPEVLNSHPHTEKSDVYSFGIVLWELFHRQDPYVGKDILAVAFEVADKGLRPTILPSCPPEMSELMQQCWAEDPSKRPNFQEIMDRLRMMMMQNPLHSISTPSLNSRVEAPTGTIYMINTVISYSNTLWDVAPRAFQDALIMHNTLIRTTLESYGGYELEFNLNGFLVSFGNLQAAMNWCIAVQVSLLNLAWPAELLEVKQASEQKSANGELLWRGLRVRMAIHTGNPSTEINASNGRVNFTGTIGEKVKSFLNETSQGFILASADVVNEINDKNIQFSEKLSFEGHRKLSHIFSVYPASLSKRKLATSTPPGQASKASLSAFLKDDSTDVSRFSDDEETLLPNSIPMEESTASGADSSREEDPIPSWMIKWEALNVKQQLGRGAIGDHYFATLNGKEVAVKILVNQKMREEDVIRLIGDASVMSKIKHPNLTPVVGLCLDKGHISVITEFVGKGNLRALLSLPNNPHALPREQRVRIAIEIAKAMAFLSSQLDRDVALHDNFKSNNVLIGHSFDARVTDFGQSNVKDLARTMTSIASVAWTAPEVLDGAPLSNACAVYAFGIIMWELYTSKMPYDNEHPIRVVSKILAGYRPVVPAECPPGYKMLMEKCWSADPDDRPSWHVIQTELNQLLYVKF